jgi:signal transduction histidine kinase
VEAQGGQVWVESQMGLGTTVTIQFPKSPQKFISSE